MRNLSINAQRRGAKSRAQSDDARGRVTAYSLAEQLAALPRTDDIESFGPLVLAIMAGAPSAAFVQLDEKPGLYGGSDCYEWFYMLRQVRNHPDYGRQLFAGFSDARRVADGEW